MKKILIIDDSKLVRDLLSSMAKSLNKETFIAESGQVGLEILFKHYNEIGLIFIDHFMPQMTGLDIISKISEHTEADKIPKFILSAGNSKRLIQSAKNTKVNGWLVKPLPMEQFEGLINNYMQT